MTETDNYIANHYFGQLDIAAQTWVDNPVEHLRQNYIKHYDWCISTFAEGTPGPDWKPYVKKLFEHMPRISHISVHGPTQHTERISPEQLTTLLFLIDDPGNQDMVANMSNKDETLAWFCANHSVRYIDNYNHEFAVKFKQVLENWTGHSLDDSFIPHTGNVIPLLYGKACWDLYGCDLPECETEEEADDAQQAVWDILAMQLPLVCKRGPGASDVAMPDFDIE